MTGLKWMILLFFHHYFTVTLPLVYSGFVGLISFVLALFTGNLF